MKSSRELRLTDEARADVRDISRYTARRWGPRQRDRYAAQLHRALRSLLDHPERGRVRDEYYPGCRSLAVEHHVVFYHLTEREIVVVPILHGSRDAASNVAP